MRPGFQGASMRPGKARRHDTINERPYPVDGPSIHVHALLHDDDASAIDWARSLVWFQQGLLRLRLV